MDSVMEGLMEQCPLPQNFWDRTAPAEDIATTRDKLSCSALPAAKSFFCYFQVENGE